MLACTSFGAGAQETKEPIDVTKARVEGVIVDESGAGVGGALVRPIGGGWKEGPASVKTSPSGKFQLVVDAPSARYHTFIASDTTQDRQGIVRLQDTALEAVVPLRIVLKPARSVRVSVTDATKTPIRGATVGVVELYTVLDSAVTGAQGTVWFKIPADAKVSQIVAIKPGVGFDYFENYNTWPRTEPLALSGEVKLVVTGAQKVTVGVADSAGKPLPNIQVVPWTIRKKGRLGYVNLGAGLKRLEVRTDEKGLAVFDWIPPDLEGRIAFFAGNEKFHQPVLPIFDPATPNAPVTTRLLATVPMTGKVLLPDGRPAGGVLIQAEGRGATAHYFRGLARTRADGTFDFNLYPKQTYLFAVTDADWAAPLFSGINVEENANLKNLLTFHLRKGSMLRGRVTVGKDKKASPGHTVTIIQLGFTDPAPQPVAGRARGDLVRWAFADKEGRYSMRLGPGEYRIWADHRDQQNLAVASEPTIVRDFHIESLPDKR
jgi:hypothetical protein